MLYCVSYGTSLLGSLFRYNVIIWIVLAIKIQYLLLFLCNLRVLLSLCAADMPRGKRLRSQTKLLVFREDGAQD